tara:strand:- start:380 stop:862 length:483 start_codon:yes stop_codon:yes gene_type:complete
MITIINVISIISTGMMAGIFFTWTNAVKPGIGKLDNLSYLKAFQAMNRVILNAIFYCLFMMPLITLIILSYNSFDLQKLYVFDLLIASTVIYFIGVILTTIIGNIPLNEMLDKSDLKRLDQQHLMTLRKKIETRWNRFNYVRTVSSFLSFLILILIETIL